ncbi:7TM diverse intracellular signaling domain-containing protein [Marinobacter sp. SS13-12]|uniref:sensor domain-containing diguanylate cyclase n=1 Tax=Marinobacter sp. SS13-12 TaxID=3050451 RepID=UPI0025558272|nr:7TM diverse intracellular signaling domain-containing protein [Marinobacter sp. SS13-12]MDK8463352.1 7TM diverse intracellular signaling domain-containing protein [Marinobacter sp. SS13-12]
MQLSMFLVLLLCLVQGTALASTGITDPRPVILDEDSERLNISRHLSYYEDASGAYGIEDILADWPLIASVEKPDDAYNFGFTDSTYWFHTRIENRGNPSDRWVIEGLYPIIDRMDVFFLREDGRIERHLAGDSVPFATRGRTHHNINFSFDLGAGESTDVFFRVRTSGAVQMQLMLWENEAFSEADHQERFVLGIYYGLLFCMAAFNLLIFISIRDKNYLWYVSYIAFYGLLQFTLNGLAFEHLWPESTWWNNRAVSFLIAMGMFSILGFSKSFLALKENAPRLERIFVGFMVFFPLMALASLFWPAYGPVIRVTTFMASVSVLFILAGGGICLYRNFKPARYFMIAWSALLAGMILYTLKTFGLAPANFITDYGIQIGSAFEVILLSLALADRMRLLMLENQQIQEEMTHRLEQRVSERTSELEVANRQLEALSSTDGLTGVFNRRYFDERLSEESVRCSRSGPLSLLMIDVDLFKPLNDSLGHQAGDACLKALASAISATVNRRADVVARYGGEEFVVILPDTDSAGARLMADQIRKKICGKLGFTWNDRAVPVSVSVGVATAPARQRVEPDELIGAADAALYEAKQGGRNTVRYRDCASSHAGVQFPTHQD